MSCVVCTFIQLDTSIPKKTALLGAWVNAITLFRCSFNIELLCDFRYAPKIPEYREKDYHESPIYTVDYQSKLSEGLKQALFLTKSVITEIGLPSRIVGLAESTTTAEQDDLAIQVITHSVFISSSDQRTVLFEYSSALDIERKIWYTF